MAYDPKLTVYTITIKPTKRNIQNSNRWLFRNIIDEANNNELEDSYIITEVFGKFIRALDTPEMFSDGKSKKCITANQPDIEDRDVSPNITFSSENRIIQGVIEGGNYGRRKNKTNTLNKVEKSDVNERDAITENFYFMIYMPLESNKMILMIQSYTSDGIDSVMNIFWENFFSVQHQFYKPIIKRFVPRSIIEDFKTNSTVSSLQFSTEIPGETLLESTSTETTRSFKITVQITPTDEDLTLAEYENTVQPLQETFFTRLMKLGHFTKKKGVLKDTTTNRTSPFDLGSSFEIQPSILLSKYITINQDESDFERIKDYCSTLLEDIKQEVYIHDAIQER